MIGASPPTAPGLAQSALSLHGVALERGGREILSDVELEVRPGEFVAVLGPNGAGKSTLMKAILGLVPLATGSVTVLGTDPTRARGRIGYLPQRRSFDRTTRIRGLDVVRLGLEGTRWGLPLAVTPAARTRRRAVRERIREAVALVGATAYAARPIGELSGGEQQRLLIAQALVGEPKLLILDEPLDSLDLPNQGAVAALVRRIATEQRIAVLLVAHDVNPLLHHLDRVLYLGGGGALAGTVDEVITAEKLSELYQTPVEVLRAADGRLVVVGQPEAPHHHDTDDG
ncbi:MAG TPA: ABC transporter ATP-binding protein [Solirubrobacteraceae bacterium]